MKTRHGDEKREIVWDSSKPSSTEIVPVLTERNATTIQPLEQTPLLPEKACSDSHLTFLKLIKSLSMKERTVRILRLNKVEVAVVEIRPRGRKVPPLSDVKRRRRNQNEMWFEWIFGEAHERVN